MQNNCISTRKYTPAVHSASKPVEIFMGSDTRDVIDRVSDTVLQRFLQAIETSNNNGSGFTYKMLLYCIIILWK